MLIVLLIIILLTDSMLSEKQIVEAVEMARKESVQRDIAIHFKVSQACISLCFKKLRGMGVDIPQRPRGRKPKNFELLVNKLK